MAKTTLTAIIAALLLIGIGCSTVVNTQVCHDRQIDFSQYQTFAFMDQSGRPARLNDPFMTAPWAREAVRQAIEKELAARGFQQVRTDDADFLIAFHAGVNDYLRDEMKHWRYTFGKHWHFTDNLSYPEGTLIVDFFDEEDNTLFWRGSAAGVLGGESGILDKMPKAVEKLIEAYPPTPEPIDSSSV